METKEERKARFLIESVMEESLYSVARVDEDGNFVHTYPENGEPTCIFCGAFGPIEDYMPCTTSFSKFMTVEDYIRAIQAL